jgi:hypothetical protein
MNGSEWTGSSAGEGRRGDSVTSLTHGRRLHARKTSVAVPFVTGAMSLLWSEFPAAGAAQVKLAITKANKPRRAAVVPPLLDALAAYQTLSAENSRRRFS